MAAAQHLGRNQRWRCGALAKRRPSSGSLAWRRNAGVMAAAAGDGVAAAETWRVAALSYWRGADRL